MAWRRWLRWVGGGLFASGPLVLVATCGLGFYLGGDAVHGKAEEGRYYVRVHARAGQSPYKEVEAVAAWHVERFLGGWFPLPVLLPVFAGIGCFFLARLGQPIHAESGGVLSGDDS